MQTPQEVKPKTAMDPTDKQVNTINELLDIADEIDKTNMQKYFDLSVKATNRLTASGAIKQMAGSLKSIP
jgi:phosphoribosylformylglycinamidine (FGAM) synthase PurS component